MRVNQQETISGCNVWDKIRTFIFLSLQSLVWVSSVVVCRCSVTDLLSIITHSSTRWISRPSNSISIYEKKDSWSNSRMHAHWSEFSTWTSYLSQSPIRQVQDNHSSQLHWPNQLLIIKYSYYLRFYYYLNQFTKEPSHYVEKIVESFYPILQTKPLKLLCTRAPKDSVPTSMIN